MTVFLRTHLFVGKIIVYLVFTVTNWVVSQFCKNLFNHQHAPLRRLAGQFGQYQPILLLLWFDCQITIAK